jgi:hypothetical protein
VKSFDYTLLPVDPDFLLYTFVLRDKRPIIPVSLVDARCHPTGPTAGGMTLTSRIRD